MHPTKSAASVIRMDITDANRLKCLERRMLPNIYLTFGR